MNLFKIYPVHCLESEYSSYLLSTEMRQPDSPQSMKLNTSSRSVVVTWSAPRDLGVPVMGYIVGYGRYIPEVYRVILGPSERSHVITDLSESCLTFTVITDVFSFVQKMAWQVQQITMSFFRGS